MPRSFMHSIFNGIFLFLLAPLSALFVFFICISFSAAAQYWSRGLQIAGRYHYFQGGQIISTSTSTSSVSIEPETKINLPAA